MHPSLVLIFLIVCVTVTIYCHNLLSILKFTALIDKEGVLRTCDILLIERRFHLINIYACIFVLFRIISL